MANVHLPKSRLEGAAKDGEGYDRCPVDGCVEVDRNFKSGGRDARGDTHLHWSTFHADPRAGGCGANWSRTTRQGLARDHALGREPLLRTRSAQGERFTSAPSAQFRTNWERIFGGGDGRPAEGPVPDRD